MVHLVIRQMNNIYCLVICTYDLNAEISYVHNTFNLFFDSLHSYDLVIVYVIATQH